MKTKRAGTSNTKHMGKEEELAKGYTSMLEAVEDYNLIGCHE
jgi:hypothetical protein